MNQNLTNNLTDSSLKNANWYGANQDRLFTEFNSTLQGLTQEEAEKRQKQFGLNRLPQAEPSSWLGICLRQFQSPFVYILAIAALVSIAIGEWIDASFIFGVLCLNAAIGGFQEWKAEKSAQALQKLLQTRATVERNGRIFEISAEKVVPGDIIWLESGNRVPADARLIMSHGLEVDESLLTGESLAVHKDSHWSSETPVPVTDRRNMGHAGSIVVRGRAKGLVVATGTTTEVGHVAKAMLGADSGKPPLMVRMEKFSQMLAWVVMGIILVVGIMGVWLQGHSMLNMLMFAVALAVAVIPEGLPVALTIALAIGTNRMARRGVIVRRLAAVEGLGSCTLIASDKTGTLTCNELTVREIRLPDSTLFRVSGQGFVPEGIITEGSHQIKLDSQPSGLISLVQAAVLCNEADLHHHDGDWVYRGDPTDIALLSLGEKLRQNREELLTQFPQVNQIPFEPEYRFSATYHEIPGDTVKVFVKGSPEKILSLCQNGHQNEKALQLKMAEEMASQGFRVLAFAEGTLTVRLDEGQAPEEPSGLTFLGFAGMIDPLRSGVREAMSACREAGIEVAIITGDHPVTALAIAHDLGLDLTAEQVVTGDALTSKNPKELQSIVQTARVFARVAPNQKLELVQAMQNAGHFVAVTGDGVNDAPALRAANIGSAMGKSGTDVAREAAELVISDDNFATIVGGVEEGRIAYNNIRKIIFMLISTGAAEVVLVCLALVAGLPLPLTPVQLLWLNLVTQGIQDVGMGFEPGEGDELKQRPRKPNERIFDALMIERSGIVALWLGGIGFLLFQGLIENGTELGTARNVLLLFIVLSINIHMANCRSETKSAFKIPLMQNPFLFFGVSGAFLIHVLSMYVPLAQHVLKTEPVSTGMWLLVGGLAGTILILMEWHKRWWNARQSKKDLG